ncbi:MAG TPA: hypothetical protein V6D13_01915 [Halomicronema sp.]
MSVRDIIFPIVFTVAVISTNYKTAFASSSKLILFTETDIEVPVIATKESPKEEKPQPPCGKEICP